MASPVPESIELKLFRIEKDLKHLKLLYEQHFAGLLKLEPLREHDAFKKALNGINMLDVKATATKFRYQGIKAQYLQYQRLWEKIHRQIEEGTYKRDLFLLEKKTSEQQRPDWANSPNAAAEKTSNAPAKGKSLKQLEDLYDKVKASMKAGDKIPAKEKFVESIQKELQRAREKNPGKTVSIGLTKKEDGKLSIKIGVKS